MMSCMFGTKSNRHKSPMSNIEILLVEKITNMINIIGK